MRFVHIILINIFFVSVLFLGTDAQQKINIRDALFTSKVDPDFFRVSLIEINSNNTFISFDGGVLNDFKEANSFRVSRVTYPDLLGKSTVENVKKLVLKFSRNGIEGGCGNYSHDLMENIEWIVKGNGCCSDHAQVFIALSLLHGIGAREVHHGLHTFNEYWDEQLQKWVWLDPQFALMAKDDNGTYLSLIELHDQMKLGKPVLWDFFGTELHVFSKQAVAQHEYYQAQPFGSVIMTLGNNVFQEDGMNHNLSFLPKSIRQFVMHLVGVKPGYAYYVDPIGTGETFASRIKPYQIGIQIYLFSNLLLLVWWLVRIFKARKL